jgi:hypothetical protein
MQTKIKVAVILVCLFVMQLGAHGQRTFRGLIRDAEKQPVAGATVTLQHDSIRRSAVSNGFGAFAFEELAAGAYLLTISAVGFSMLQDTLNMESTTQAKENQYTITRGEKLLQAVSVTANKNFIEQKIDRTVVNVDALVSNAGVTALDVLENAPGVIVSDGAISLKGKSGVVIFIDDKPTYLSGADVTNYLKSLPSGSLDKIEIMPNPPARYDAAGNAGVINIRTKKSRSRGFNGSLNIAFGQGRYSRTNNSLTFNYRNQKLNFFGTASYSVNNGFNDLDIYRYYLRTDGNLRSTFFQNSFIRQTSHATNLKAGVDFFLNPKTALGVLVNGVYRPYDSKTINKSVVSDAAGTTDSVITADNREHNNWKKGSFNLNYLHKYNIDRELSFDVDYITYASNQDQIFLNAIFGPSGNLKSGDGLTGQLPSVINIYSAKSDYSHSLTPTMKVAAGGKISYVSTDNAANYYTVINNTTKPDYDKTNHFLYKENINAVYLNLNKDWDRLSLQTGLRLENTVSDGHQLGNAAKPDSSFRRHYTNLFPTLYLVYKLDTLSRHQLSFSYGRRIERPFYQDLNPFISPLDKFSVYVGNPYLNPSFTNTFELSHIFKKKITTTLSYNATANIVEETIDLANGIYTSRPANIGKSSVLGISVTSSAKPAAWWVNTLFAEVQNRSYKGLLYDYILDTNAVYFGANMTNQFTLGKGWTAELGGNYRTAILFGQIISGQTGRVNAGIAKRILNNQGSLKLNFRDIFRTGLNHGIITSIKNAYATYHNWGDTRSVSLTFSYNFGKTTSLPRTRNSGAETEQNRVKN